MEPGSGLPRSGPVLIISLQRAQAIFGKADQINRIFVFNRAGELARTNLSREVTSELRARLSDSEVASRLKGLLSGEKELEALERRQKSLRGGFSRDLSRLRDELQHDGVSEELISLLAAEHVADQVLEALRRDGLKETEQEAQTLFPEVAEFQVFDVKRQFDEEPGGWWSTTAIAAGFVALLGVGAWAVFRRKEL